jgi:hypothetical protein
MILIGCILLLPGLCALFFGGMALKEASFDTGLLPFIMVGLLVGAVGVGLIVAAFRSS